MVGGEDTKGRMDLLLQERQKQQRLRTLKSDTHRKIDFVRHKAIIEYHDVYQIIRDFFKEFLEQRYEFTINELRQELKKVYISNTTRQQISALLERLEVSEYATVHYPREELVKLLDEFSGIVDQLVHVHTTTKSFFERMKTFLFKETDPGTIIAELPVREGDDAYHVRIYTLIEKCYIALDKHNMHRAKAAYHVLLAEYNLLDDDRKAEYYDVIQQTYHDLENRAKMQR